MHEDGASIKDLKNYYINGDIDQRELAASLFLKKMYRPNDKKLEKIAWAIINEWEDERQALLDAKRNGKRSK